MLNSIAEIRDATENPGTKRSIKRTSAPLRRSRKIPNVIIVSGKVKITRIGFMKVLTTPSITATTNNELNESILTPGKIYDATYTAAIRIKSLTIIFIN